MGGSWTPTGSSGASPRRSRPSNLSQTCTYWNSCQRSPAVRASSLMETFRTRGERAPRMRRRYLAAATAVLVTAGLGLPAGPAQAAPAKAPTFGHTVTLITGDRVTVTGDRLLVRPAKGREHLQFRTFKRAGHLSVVPADALALVRTGRLDGRLFDVTAQVGYGYDQRADLPLLVTPAGRSLAKPAVPA